MLWQGQFKQWNDGNIIALEFMVHRLTLKNQKILKQFSAARKMGLLTRLFYIKRSGIYRQTLLGNVGIIVAVVLGRL
jgi:hypothetical protein